MDQKLWSIAMYLKIQATKLICTDQKFWSILINEITHELVYLFLLESKQTHSVSLPTNTELVGLVTVEHLPDHLEIASFMEIAIFDGNSENYKKVDCYKDDIQHYSKFQAFHMTFPR